MVARRVAVILTALACVTLAAQDIQVPKVPDTLPDGIREDLQIVRACLNWRLEEHNKRVEDFARRCPKPSAACDREFETIHAAELSYAGDVNRLDTRIKAAAAQPRTVNANPRTVDARVAQVGVEALVQVGELACSPGTNFIRRGYEAIAKHDWPLALPLWQSALFQDPNNAALQRTVDLAQWMVEYQKKGGASKTLRDARKDPARPNPAKLNQLLINKWLDDLTQYLENWLDRPR